MTAGSVQAAPGATALVRSVADLRRRVAGLRSEGIVLVPTMGALHEGHLRLIDIAKEHGGHIVVSIFVNPIQFNSAADLARYPRTLESDVEACSKRGAHTVFAPSADEVYPWASDLSSGTAALTAGAYRPTRVQAGSAAEGLCGGTRPGHFDGVVTVVAILFNMVQPDAAVFGDKDYQQATVIERMVRDLHFPVRIVRAPIVRDRDGLALSSRNVLLSAEDRFRALYISKTLFKAEELVRAGERDTAKLVAIAAENLAKSEGLRVDYLELVDAGSLRPMSGNLDRPAQLCIAAFAGDVRLIDNIRLEPGW